MTKLVFQCRAELFEDHFEKRKKGNFFLEDLTKIPSYSPAVFLLFPTFNSYIQILSLS